MRFSPFFLAIFWTVAGISFPAWSQEIAPRVSETQARTLFNLAKKGDWAQIDAMAPQGVEGGVGYLLNWMRLKDPRQTTVDLSKASQLIDLYSDWPGLSSIRETVEASCIRQMSDEGLVNWFLSHPPKTIEGEMAYAAALLKTGRKTEGIQGLKALWYSASLSEGQQRRFLEMFSAHLTPQDFIHRLDEMIWNDKQSDARRLLTQVPEQVSQDAQIRLRLLAADKSGDALWASLSEESKASPALLYAYIYYLRKSNQDDKAIEFLKRVPPQVKQVHGANWWSHQAPLARVALKTQGAVVAYEIAASHGLYRGSDFVEAEWFSGWLALRFLQKPERASGHFNAVLQASTQPITQARALYWLGRTYASAGEMTMAAPYYEKASQYSYTYYGQLAAIEAGKKRLTLPTSHMYNQDDPQGEDDFMHSTWDMTPFDQLPIVQAIQVAQQVGAMQEEKQLLFSLSKNSQNPAHHQRIAALIKGRGQGDLQVKIGKSALANGVMYRENLYPVPSWLKSFTPQGVEKPLVAALSRQESEFDASAVSPVGAKGLMQVMPATAAQVASRLGMGGSVEKGLLDPSANLQIGTQYLSELVNKYNGSYVLALAAYNAGPGRVNRWLNDYGDPRTSRTDAIDWVELIPYPETRNYVQRIMEGVAVYRAIFSDSDIELTLKNELQRR